MNKYKKAFTLVEMLFVVIIAAWALGMAAYKLKDMKKTGEEKGATGFLVALASAKSSMEQDLALQGIDLDGELHKHTNENIKIDPQFAELASVVDKTLAEYLENNNYSKDAFVKALFSLGYLDRAIPTVGHYGYFINIGFNVSTQCGNWTSAQQADIVAYMCRGCEKGQNDQTTCEQTGGKAYLKTGIISDSE